MSHVDSSGTMESATTCQHLLIAKNDAGNVQTHWYP